MALTTMGLGVPLYQHPGLDSAAWDALAVQNVPLRWVVLNQASGPGAAEDSVLYDAARSVKAAGVPVLGYLNYGYGAVVDFTTFADADKYVARGITDGIFLDQVPTAAANVQALGTTLQGLRKRGARHIVLNCGTVPLDERYLAMADQVVTFEGTLPEYRTAMANRPAWLREWKPEKVVHLLHGVTTWADARDAVLLARASGCHTIFMHTTPYTGPSSNPWDGIPNAYWQDLTDLVASFPARPAPGWPK
ncbi:spherulation-specific family 4 protein [Kitasatospora sp. NPDC097605]|uniref:spherulation-specific family 4 protein n=1 Tax=Kitasatospora sp. NPDC097605 TaxID=3157226 RepID=UPI003330D9CB